jgi:ABC-type Na+ efflux pump permease subunit
MNKIWTLIQKEWAEVFKNRFVLFTVAFLPLLFAVLPLVILYVTKALNLERELKGKNNRIISGFEEIEKVLSENIK